MKRIFTVLIVLFMFIVLVDNARATNDCIEIYKSLAYVEGTMCDISFSSGTDINYRELSPSAQNIIRTSKQDTCDIYLKKYNLLWEQNNCEKIFGDAKSELEKIKQCASSGQGYEVKTGECKITESIMEDIKNDEAKFQMTERVKGKILLQTEDKGQAWYVEPKLGKRHYIANGDRALDVMKNFGVGVTNKNLDKISIGKFDYLGEDSDGDGLADRLEDALGTDKNLKDTDGDGYDDAVEVFSGYNPKGCGNLVDKKFADRQKGKILLQVESRGEAWYINPADGKRYFLGRPSDAFNLMRSLGLGISNNDIEKIIVGA